MTDWKRKLAAYLHDPPEKAYDYSPEHGERAKHYAGRVGLKPADWPDKLPDHAAAAADRFIFPATKRKEGDRWVDTGVPGLGGGLQFIHPLSGQKVDAVFPTEDEAMGYCRDGFPDFAGIEDPQLRFWLIWRLWRQFTVEQPEAKKFALALASLPADTRIPDGTIWHHDSVVSALEAARDNAGAFAPAFLLFQIGPVQEFIAQARSTRDAWSGSYLLSWMMAHAMKELADKIGPDCLIYPSLLGQPLYDWLEKEKLKRAKHISGDGTKSKSFWPEAEEENAFGQRLALTPNLPNRFLAIVPAGFDAKQIEAVFNADGWDRDDPGAEPSAWARIVRACWQFLPKDGMPKNAKQMWDFQVRHFWRVTWELWPWQEVKPALESFQSIPLGKNSHLHRGRELALAVPDLHKDARCYANGFQEIKSSGWAWSAHYQLLAHRLDARRQTRDFEAWQSTAEPGHKDHFSGKEETVATASWLGKVRANEAMSHLFRHDDELGAVNLIKRVWHKAYLEEESKFDRHGFKFDSVPAIAAEPWKKKVLEAMSKDSRASRAFLDFQAAVRNARRLLEFELTDEKSESDWLKKVDAAVFQSSCWENLKLAREEDERLRVIALASLSSLLKAAGVGQPGKYFAVLALDGDQIGKWLSGAKTPMIKEVITEKAVKYFRENLDPKKGEAWEAWLSSPRPLSPSYHLQFSEALANFGLYCARRVVEAHQGQLVYSGGDDVLAILPAGEAIACARGLRLAFKGCSNLAEMYPALFLKTDEGFIQLRPPGDTKGDNGSPSRRRSAEPTWPLLVPGPRATVSVGIAIGHIKEPLQDMIQEAQAAEKRAKAAPEKEIWDSEANEAKWKLNEGWNRDAMAITLFKRSGETIRWGSKFDSHAFAILRELRDYYRAPVDEPSREMPISGKFPYRIAELLSRYEADGPLTQELRDIAAKELVWAINQQTWSDPESERSGDEFRRGPFEHRCVAYLDELLAFRWQRKSGTVETSAARPLREFINLFALEAFIARQAE